MSQTRLSQDERHATRSPRRVSSQNKENVHETSPKIQSSTSTHRREGGEHSPEIKSILKKPLAERLAEESKDGKSPQNSKKKVRISRKIDTSDMHFRRLEEAMQKSPKSSVTKSPIKVGFKSPTKIDPKSPVKAGSKSPTKDSSKSPQSSRSTSPKSPKSKGSESKKSPNAVKVSAFSSHHSSKTKEEHSTDPKTQSRRKSTPRKGSVAQTIEEATAFLFEASKKSPIPTINVLPPRSPEMISQDRASAKKSPVRQSLSPSQGTKSPSKISEGKKSPGKVSESKKSPGKVSETKKSPNKLTETKKSTTKKSPKTKSALRTKNKQQEAEEQLKANGDSTSSRKKSLTVTFAPEEPRRQSSGQKSGTKSPRRLSRSGTMTQTAEEGVEYLKREGFESGKRRLSRSDDEASETGDKISEKKVKK